MILFSVLFGIFSHVSRAYRWNFMLEPLGYKPKVLNNLGIAIISTSQGVMTNLKAKNLGIGGEVLCYIW